MREAIVIGSGPAAMGACLALTGAEDVALTVLDLGAGPEPAALQMAADLRARPRTDFPLAAPAPRGEGPRRPRRGLPEKRVFGSSYSFRDIGQLAGLAVGPSLTRPLVSAAYGGFSTVWGAQCAPYPSSVLGRWPDGGAGMAEAYRAVSGEVPITPAGADDLAAALVLPDTSGRGLPLAPRTERVLAAAKGLPVARRAGVAIGRTRVAVRSDACTACGLCMSGCPWGCIWSAADSFDRWRRERRITYCSGMMVIRVATTGLRVEVLAQRLPERSLHTFTADRVYVAAGAVATTRLVLQSLGEFRTRRPLLESRQFVVPWLSRRAVPDPRRQLGPTLGQAGFYFPSLAGADAYVQLYPYDPAFVAALPFPLQHGWAGPLQTALVRHLSVGLGYLSSHVSPRLQLEVASPPDPHSLAPLTVTCATSAAPARRALRILRRRWRSLAPRLDLWPVWAGAGLSPAGASYHWGGALPYRDGPRSHFETDRLGCLEGWTRVHVVDAATFPEVASTTCAMTVMANAHRIAQASLREVW